MANVGAKEITLTNLNIRQSISILLAKLIVLDFVLALIVIVLYFAVIRGADFFGVPLADSYIFLTVFGTAGLVKIMLTSYVILEWMNEYYEITTEYISHKSGIIFKKTQNFRLDHIRAMEVSSPLLGEMLNFGTITLYDIRLERELDMYLIHNPMRYAKVLRQLRPRIEEKTDATELPFVLKDES